ncbi:DedA family protein [Nocardia farcinica]|uniref:VTT domain-containing protein n=2 Tax=Nocardia farcinica TaxID=37329 RepID=Q5YNK4_NOCFA|nr:MULTISPECIES: DedA family protein [Nocardia]AXK87370.1 DedA family protein [Nocardia farcinica]MBA4858943.1 DedA family protein [Nocardia farcinica]MBC9817070.1 DedA family protein [Nocardia farcinica]MBF6068895.1 DedA family protein [Nocardia farcinica]MBF6140778.1 DedA family protein [Nocardia farcinica]
MVAASGGLNFLESAGPTLVWVVVISFVFLECAVIVGLFLPGDSMLLTAGVVLAGHHAGEKQIWALALGAMVAAIAGNQVGYVIGHRTGTGFVARRNGRYVNAENLRRVTLMLDKHGFWAVLLARWIPWVRTLCPLVAGAARMDHRRYTIASTLGAIAWAPVLLLIGFYAGNHLKRVPWLMHGVTAALVLGLIVGTIVGIRHYRQEMNARVDEFDMDAPTVVLPRWEPDAERR